LAYGVHSSVVAEFRSVCVCVGGVGGCGWADEFEYAKKSPHKKVRFPSIILRLAWRGVVYFCWERGMPESSMM